MPPEAVGADQHQRADRIEHGTLDLVVGDFDALCLCLVGDLAARGLGFGGPLARQRRRQIVARNGGPVAARPAWTGGLGLDGFLLITQRLEERLPAFIHGGRVVGVAGVHLFQILGVVALHEGGRMELLVGGMVGHGGRLA